MRIVDKNDFVFDSKGGLYIQSSKTEISSTKIFSGPASIISKSGCIFLFIFSELDKILPER